MRIPASFNGLFSFKPTPGKTSLTGYRSAQKDSFTPFNHITASQGPPIGKSFEDMFTCFKVQIDPDIDKLDLKVPKAASM